MESLYGKPLPDRASIGEAWEVADLPEGQSLVDNGPLAGQPLGEVVQRWQDGLIGGRTPDGAFPLLVKLLDAQDDLSVQVHPGQEHLGAELPGARSKDECWLILDAEPDGAVLHGFDGETDRDAFDGAIRDGRATELLRRVPVQPGDVIRVAPGTVHAICKGVVLLEIQQPSDTTYRVYDYKRPGLDGRLRPLHLEQAFKVTDFRAPGPARLRCEEQRREVGDWSLLVDVPAYRIEKVRVRQAVRWDVDCDSAQIVVALKGRCRLVAESGEPVELRTGQTAVIPACAGQVRLEPVVEGRSVEVVVAGLGGAPLADFSPA